MNFSKSPVVTDSNTSTRCALSSNPAAQRSSLLLPGQRLPQSSAARGLGVIARPRWNTRATHRPPGSGDACPCCSQAAGRQSRRGRRRLLPGCPPSRAVDLDVLHDRGLCARDNLGHPSLHLRGNAEPGFTTVTYGSAQNKIVVFIAILIWKLCAVTRANWRRSDRHSACCY